MGAWGYGPFDNDSAADMVALLMRDVKIVAERKSDDSARYRYASARAAVQILLLAHETDILGGTSLEMGARALSRMRKDQEWLGTWDDPQAVASAINAEMGVLLSRARLCKGYSKSLRTQLESIVVTAIGAQVPKVAAFKERGSKRRRWYGKKRHAPKRSAASARAFEKDRASPEYAAFVKREKAAAKRILRK